MSWEETQSENRVNDERKSSFSLSPSVQILGWIEFLSTSSISFLIDISNFCIHFYSKLFSFLDQLSSFSCTEITLSIACGKTNPFKYFLFSLVEFPESWRFACRLLSSWHKNFFSGSYFYACIWLIFECFTVHFIVGKKFSLEFWTSSCTIRHTSTQVCSNKTN